MMGSPFNAIKALFDKEIPLKIRIAFGLFGLFAWSAVLIKIFGSKS